MLKVSGIIILVTLKIKKIETKKMSLANMQGKLSRTEMKNIMAGLSGGAICTCNSADQCTATNELCMNSGCDKGTSGYQGTCGCPSVRAIHKNKCL